MLVYTLRITNLYEYTNNKLCAWIPHLASSVDEQEQQYSYICTDL